MSNEPGPGTRDGRLRIAISGKSGCGNSTVSRLVADRLGLRLINYTFKDLAREQGLSFEEICRRAEVDPQYDLTIDRMQVRLAEQGGCRAGLAPGHLAPPRHRLHRLPARPPGNQGRQDCEA